MNQGSCLCGDITWQIEVAPVMMSNCHCSMCRKFHGMGYGCYIAVPTESFRWLSGEDKVRTYESSPGGHRPFCPRCGSKVPAPIRSGDLVFMASGNMEGDLDVSLDSHIFVGSKAPWVDITDDAAQWDEYPEGYDIPATQREDRAPQTKGAIGGSCLCGKVRFEFDESLGMMGHCHCSRCRKSRSAPHSTQLFVSPDKFRWLSGEDNIEEYRPDDAEFFTASFCRDCGSMVPKVYAERGNVQVPAGSLDQDPGIRPQAHIYVGSKAPWVEINDDLLTFEAMPPAPPG